MRRDRKITPYFFLGLISERDFYDGFGQGHPRSEDHSNGHWLPMPGAL